jgi:hypothetical protein
MVMGAGLALPQNYKKMGVKKSEFLLMMVPKSLKLALSSILTRTVVT